MTNETIIARIKKLLRLSEGNPNEHEAAQAARRAQILMDKYQISYMDTDDIEKGEVFGVSDIEISQKGYYENWYTEFFGSIARLHDLKPYLNKRSPAGKRITRLQVIGLNSDIELFRHNFNFLLNAVVNLYKKAWDEEKIFLANPMEHVHQFRRAFSLGCAHRIIRNLKEAQEFSREAMTGSQELVIYKKDLIQKYEDQSNLNLKKAKKRNNDINARAYAKGKSAARGVNLNRMVEK